MELEKGFKPAMVTTELVVAIGLAVVAVVIAIALFSQPLSDIISHTGFKNMFKTNSAKTSYADFSRDYTNSQIDVQLTGAQGLLGLRRKANNKAIDVIEEKFDDTNEDGNSIAYLAMALTIITGEPNVCTYMTTDTDKHCGEFSEYNYKVALNGSEIDITKAATGKSIHLSLVSLASSTLGAINVAKDTNSNSKLSTNEKYAYILDMTKKMISVIRADVVLVNIFTTFDNNKINNTVSSQDVTALKSSITTFTTQLMDAANTSYNACHNVDWGGDDRRFGVRCGSLYSQLEDNDKSVISAWQIKLNNSIANAQSISDAKTIFENSLTTTVLNAIEQDNYIGEHSTYTEDRKTCTDLLNNFIAETNRKYKLSIAIKAEESGTVAKTAVGASAIEAVSTAAAAVADTTTIVVDTVSNVASSVADTVSDIASSVADTVSDTASSVVNTVSEKASSVKNSVKDAWDSFWD